MLAAASTCLVLLTSWGGTEYEWGDRVIIGLAAGAVVSAALFVLAEKHAAEPIILLRLFRDSVFNLSGLVGMVVGVALFGAASYLPTFLQMVGGASATESGLLMLPMMGGVVGASIVSGQLISHTGRYKLYPILGGALSTLGMYLLSRLEVDTPRLEYSVYMAVLGAGIGLIMPVLVLAVQNSVRAADLGTATSANNYFRQIGGSVGAAIFGTLFADRLADSLADRLPTGGELPGRRVDHPAARARDARGPARPRTSRRTPTRCPRIFLYLVPVLVLGLLAFFSARPPLVQRRPLPRPRPRPSTPSSRSRSGVSYAAGVPVCGTVQHSDGTAVPRAALTLIERRRHPDRARRQRRGRPVRPVDARHRFVRS